MKCTVSCLTGVVLVCIEEYILGIVHYSLGICFSFINFVCSCSSFIGKESTRHRILHVQITSLIVVLTYFFVC
jgi:hypothetical protein